MSRKLLPLLIILSLTAAATPRRRAVQPPSAEAGAARTFTFDFAAGSPLGWEAGFADYNPITDMRTTGEIRLAPAEVGGRPAYYLSGWNYSDDLFMFLRRRLSAADGIIPNQNYLADFTLTFATNVGKECGGIGGHPGDSVFIKLGASPEKPEPVLVGDHLRLNVDKGNQSQSGTIASNAGTITAEAQAGCSVDAQFSTVVRRHSHRYAIPSSATGDLWLLFGTDSGFEGFTQIYVQRIEVTLTPVAANDPRARWQTTYAAVDSIITALQSAGVIVRDVGSAFFDEIGGRDVVYAIGAPGALQEIHFYIFDTDEAAASAQTLVAPDGSRIAGIPGNWTAPPHFYRCDHLIVNYVGSDPTVLLILRERLGPQFAGPPG